MFDWITGLLDTVGPLGVAILMFLENVFPPIPSELIMPLAGFNAAQGEGNIVVTIVAGVHRLARRRADVVLCRPLDRPRPGARAWPSDTGAG